MNRLTRQEIAKVVFEYIGVAGGYLGDFSYATHTQFYPLYCDLDIDPNGYQGTTRERFIKILDQQAPCDQAKILRGVLVRFPADDLDASSKRTQELKVEIEQMIARLSQRATVESPVPRITSTIVHQALIDAENLIQTSGFASAVDRVHTALHGYLKAACDQQGIVYDKDDTIMRLLKLLRLQHPALQSNASGIQDAERILAAFGTILDALNNIRNHASLAHANQCLLDAAEAVLAINSARTILRYLDDKLQDA